MSTLTDRVVAALSSRENFAAVVKEHVVHHPTHVLLETFLCLFIAYVLLIKRAYDPKKRCARARGGAGPNRLRNRT